MSTPRALIKNPTATFGITWAGQFVSLLGSELSAFVVGAWIYEETRSTTQFALLLTLHSLPVVVLSPFVGALVDRWDRRRAMLLSDLGSGFGTLIMWLMFYLSAKGVWTMRPWYLFAPTLVIACFDSFRWPAFTATTSLLVPKKHLGRANGMLTLASGVGQIGAPLLAGALLMHATVTDIVFYDLLSFGAAVGTLLLVRFPKPPESEEGRQARGSLWKEAAAGWRFITARPGLKLLLAWMGSFLVVQQLVMLLMTPLVLSFATIAQLGVLRAISGVGIILGGLAITAWGGPRRRIPLVLGGCAAAGAVLFAAALPFNLTIMTAASAIFLFITPFVSTSSQAIWQVKVVPDMQGRVFAVRRVVGTLSGPLAGVLAGPLADGLFEPWLKPDGALAGSVGRVFGTGPGRGIAFFFVLLGAGMILSTALAYTSARLRNVESELPDALPEPKSPSPETSEPSSAPDVKARAG